MYSLAILISGNGSNLQAIIDAINEDKLPAKISLVLSDKTEAFGLERAKKAAIPTAALNPKQYSTRDEFDKALATILDDYQPDLIVLAGFMRILNKSFVQHFRGRIINIHPALLPAYKGLNTHERVLAAGEKEHGITIHFVTEALDNGPIIAQSKLLIKPDDTAESLKKSVQTLERQLYPEVIRWFAEKKITQENDDIYVEGKKLPSCGVLVVY
jgi:phosphoribosylglycinamide formyltransferase-1